MTAPGVEWPRRSSKQPEERPDALGQQSWFLPCDEVPTPPEFHPVPDVAIPARNVFPRRTLDELRGDEGDSRWDLDGEVRRHRPWVVAALVVRPRGRIRRLG